ncbi:MAG: 30S ribosomal protein S20 [Phycisphaerae bacterium]|nr:30S ribosomal protein S20 [Phycisphaerae bacterium]
MAHSLSAKKRIRQNATRRARNRARKSQLKATVRAFADVVATGDQNKTAEQLKVSIKKIDQIAAKGAIHKNTASRKKSQLQRTLNAMKAGK